MGKTIKMLYSKPGRRAAGSWFVKTQDLSVDIFNNGQQNESCRKIANKGLPTADRIFWSKYKLHHKPSPFKFPLSYGMAVKKFFVFFQKKA